LPTAYRLGSFSEDCLYLNVWTAAKSPADKLPVIVYVPGGGFTTGSGSALVFDGESFARKGIVPVTINYRLGALGFLGGYGNVSASESESGIAGRVFRGAFEIVERSRKLSCD
jgi:para-nitrobenzyl esterase